jgi:hypothetical protein
MEIEGRRSEIMVYLIILANMIGATTPAPQAEEPVVPMQYFWQQIVALNWFEAVIAISFGTIYLFYGWRIFRIVVTISFGLIGLYLGLFIGERIDNVIWGGVIGFCALAAVSLPLMRWAVCALGAFAGGILTGSVWYAFELPDQYILAGALIGIVAGGMISFIIFKYSVMLFTSLQGGALIVAGGLALIHLYVKDPVLGSSSVEALFFQKRWFLPLLLIVTAAVGLILQNRLIRDYAKWDCQS